MRQDVVPVGIDVVDARYHGRALGPLTGEALEFLYRSTLKGLVRQLEKLRGHLGGVCLQPCYEASDVGFSLQRDLRVQGCDCELVASTSTPRRPCKAVKTDRIDAADLAQRYATGLLTAAATPTRKHLFALTMITEIGDVKRFAHPSQLMPWVGMEIREHASGGKSNRLGIPRQRNRHLHAASIEANQRGYRTIRSSRTSRPGVRGPGQGISPLPTAVCAA